MAMAANDVRLLNFLISPGFSMLFDAFINLFVPIVIILAIPSKFPIQLAIIPIAFAVIFIISLGKYVKKLAPLTAARRLEFGIMNSVLNESLDGIEVIKSMSQEKASIEKYRESAIAYRDIGIKSGYIQAKYFPLLYVAIAITLGLTHSIILYNAGEITVIGDIIAYIGILGRLRFPTMASNWAFFIVQRAKAGAERLIDTMLKVSEIGDPKDAVSKAIEGNIEFKNVSFNYPGTNNEVLKNISFEIKSGRTIAVVGMTGSGKTTLTKLISRLYDINSGEILIDGIDIRNYSLKSLRDQIAYIEQDVFLFSKSAKDNIAFGRNNVSDEQIISAAKEAQAHDFISALPNQYDTEVGERGVQLSGGERQRIAIARAFLSEPSILILDDSSSAIDAKTEEKIQTAITRILHGRTTFLITHRLSQIRWADLILVLKRGEIVTKGTHKELLQNSEEYRKIFVKRFDKTFDELLGGSD
jgi:ATP-binding cassette subfamily B protein